MKNAVAKIRAFNRFYTGLIGLLDKYILNSQYTLSEVRVLYELATHENHTATDLTETLRIDKGYVSRMLLVLKTKKLIQSKRSSQDGRSLQLTLTKIGRREFNRLNRASDQQLAVILKKLTAAERDRLVRNMNEIVAILSKTQ